MLRTLSLVKSLLVEVLRSPLGILGGLVALMAIPAASFLIADSNDSALWISRFLYVEGIRLVVPLLTIMGAAFLLRPRLKHGWSTLPVRRSEWLAACAVTTVVIVFITNSLLMAGSWLAQTINNNESSLQITSTVARIDRVNKNGMRQSGNPATYSWANPIHNEYLEFEVQVDGPINATVNYESALTNKQAPTHRVPFIATGIGIDNTVTKLETQIAGRKRVIVSGDGIFNRVRLIPIDQGILLGITPEGVHLASGTSATLISMLKLLALSMAGIILLICGVFLVRSLSTAPTAALAGLFLFASMTLLPSLVPATAMAKARAKALMQRKGDEKNSLGLLEKIPHIFPTHNFDEFMAGRVSGPVLSDSMARAGVALPMLLFGTLLFRRRELAK